MAEKNKLLDYIKMLFVFLPTKWNYDYTLCLFTSFLLAMKRIVDPLQIKTSKAGFVFEYGIQAYIRRALLLQLSVVSVSILCPQHLILLLSLPLLLYQQLSNIQFKQFLFFRMINIETWMFVGIALMVGDYYTGFLKIYSARIFYWKV